jgi:hypothetical protein
MRSPLENFFETAEPTSSTTPADGSTRVSEVIDVLPVRRVQCNRLDLDQNIIIPELGNWDLLELSLLGLKDFDGLHV